MRGGNSSSPRAVSASDSKEEIVSGKMCMEYRSQIYILILAVLRNYMIWPCYPSQEPVADQKSPLGPLHGPRNTRPEETY